MNNFILEIFSDLNPEQLKFIKIGGAIAIIHIYLIIYDIFNLRKYRKTTARVTAIKQEGRNNVYDVVYKDDSGNEIKVTTFLRVSLSKVNAGDDIKILYNKDNAKEIKYDHIPSLYMMRAVGLITGLAIGAFGLMV